MPEPQAKNPPAAPLAKQFDVALVDPGDPTIEHYPRVRVSIASAGLDDLSQTQKLPPEGPDGNPIAESPEGQAKRLGFLIADIERARAIAAFNEVYGLHSSQLRYDVVEVGEGTPAPAELSKRWRDHLAHIKRK